MKRQTFIVLVKESELTWSVYGIYRSFKRAEGDAKACKYPAYVFLIESPDNLP